MRSNCFNFEEEKIVSKVTIIGAGYVGLTTGVASASLNHKVMEGGILL